MTRLDRILQWLWLWLPDNCENRKGDCSRMGARGNENVLDGKVLCDECTVRVLEYRKTGEMKWP